MGSHLGEGNHDCWVTNIPKLSSFKKHWLLIILWVWHLGRAQLGDSSALGDVSWSHLCVCIYLVVQMGSQDDLSSSKVSLRGVSHHWVVQLVLPHNMEAGLQEGKAAAQVLLKSQKSQNITSTTLYWLKQVPRPVHTQEEEKRTPPLTMRSGRCIHRCGGETELLVTSFGDYLFRHITSDSDTLSNEY